VLDARRCISYLTIELRGAIPEEFRPAMGNMVFGCDICQDVCPWNRKAPFSPITEFLPRQIPATQSGSEIRGAELSNEAALDTQHGESHCNPPLEWLISFDEEEFRKSFRGSAVKRAKWRGLVRNACVAVGNSRVPAESAAHSRIAARLGILANSEDAVIAEHAQWALARLGSAEASHASHAD
jgi:epoxyqueuosine reductase